MTETEEAAGSEATVRVEDGSEDQMLLLRLEASAEKEATIEQPEAAAEAEKKATIKPDEMDSDNGQPAATSSPASALVFPGDPFAPSAMTELGDAQQLMDSASYGQPAVPKSLAQHPPKAWAWDDFFQLTPAQEVNLKKVLAKHLEISYGGVNRANTDAKAYVFAEAFGGIPAFTVESFCAARDKFKAALLTSDPVQIRDVSNVSMTVSGCLIRWKPLFAVNEGYIKEWGGNGTSSNGIPALRGGQLPPQTIQHMRTSPPQELRLCWR